MHMKQNIYSVGEFAELVGRSVQTIQRWDYEGILVSHRTATNRRYYTQDQYNEVMGITPDPSRKKVVCYTRVSGGDQKNDLESQKAALGQFVIASGIAVDEW